MIGQDEGLNIWLISAEYDNIGLTRYMVTTDADVDTENVAFLAETQLLKEFGYDENGQPRHRIHSVAFFSHQHLMTMPF